MAELVMDPVTRGEDGVTASYVEERFNRFENKNTWWRHDQNGTMDEFDAAYEAAVERMRGNLGQTYPIVIDGKEQVLESTFSVKSPADTRLTIGHFAAASANDTKRAVAAARAGQDGWRHTPWQERATIIEKAADLFTDSFYDLCAAMTFETGKSRFEASIDVDEAIDFLRFYAMSMREWNGFDQLMGKPYPNETCHSLRKPWGTFAVMAPFNFPVAITSGMTVASLLTGNTAIMKPSQKGCLSGWMVFDMLRKAGVPGTALHFITGTDNEVSQTLIHDEGIDGIVFTGSKKVGRMIEQTVAEGDRPKPVIAEMGGKNPIIITANADLDKAVQGVWKSAFGFSGQKCSACSRVYVEKTVAAEFRERLVKLTDSTTVGRPWLKETFMGPVTERNKLPLMQEVVKQVKNDDGTVLSGGVLMDRDMQGEDLHGYYMRPTIVADLPKDHRVFREEFFMPFVAICEVEDLTEALREANRVQYGLTAGIFTEDKAEMGRFFDEIEAGVTYANRMAGGSTAAVVNGQSFVGWKNSGSTGTGAGGRWYLLQFTRERSQTVA